MSIATEFLVSDCRDAEPAAIDATILSPRPRNKVAISREVVCSSVRMLDFAAWIFGGVASGLLHFYFTVFTIRTTVRMLCLSSLER